MNHPLARQEGLVVRHLTGETVISDSRSDKVHCLNPASSWVWSHCDGHTSVADLAAGLHDELGLPNSREVVELALDQLSRRGLLDRTTPPVPNHTSSRRDALKALAVAAAALPLVMTLSASFARAQAVSIASECSIYRSSTNSFEPINEGLPCNLGTGTCVNGNCVPNPAPPEAPPPPV